MIRIIATLIQVVFLVVVVEHARVKHAFFANHGLILLLIVVIRGVGVITALFHTVLLLRVIVDLLAEASVDLLLGAFEQPALSCTNSTHRLLLDIPANALLLTYTPIQLLRISMRRCCKLHELLQDGHLTGFLSHHCHCDLVVGVAGDGAL